jgi:hypothetical protein
MLMMRLMVGFHRGIRSTILVSVPARTKIIWPTIAMLMAIMLLFVGIRLATDIPNVALGRIPEDEYPRPYARHSIAAYLHIIPAAIYLLGAPFLPAPVREGHWTLHPRLGASCPQPADLRCFRNHVGRVEKSLRRAGLSQCEHRLRQLLRRCANLRMPAKRRRRSVTTLQRALTPS